MNVDCSGRDFSRVRIEWSDFDMFASPRLCKCNEKQPHVSRGCSKLILLLFIFCNELVEPLS